MNKQNQLETANKISDSLTSITKLLNDLAESAQSSPETLQAIDNLYSILILDFGCCLDLLVADFAKLNKVKT